MIKIFYGDDRVKANAEIKKLLGEDYEIIDGQDLELGDLPNIFMGVSLFADKRNILIRDFSANKAAFEQLENYLNTPHNIILLESKLDKRSNTFKALKDKIEIREFTLPEDPNFKLVFDIYKTAKKDGKRSIEMLERIKEKEDPVMFSGLLFSQAIKDFSFKQGIKEKRVLKELAKLDLDMKSAKVEPWLLIESFLLRLSSLT
ncbi:hypothetical protein IJS18_00855 [Candidatus Saccharibacteria bacterium]|nr:hypothetical protein [Candidatus Saccharibacteria bacterium]